MNWDLPRRKKMIFFPKTRCYLFILVREVPVAGSAAPPPQWRIFRNKLLAIGWADIVDASHCSHASFVRGFNKKHVT